MAIRNFWVNAKIDGRETTLAGGPKSKDGGMVIDIFQRDKGEISTALQVVAKAVNGKLTLAVCVNGQWQDVCITDR